MTGSKLELAIRALLKELWRMPRRAASKDLEKILRAFARQCVRLFNEEERAACLGDPRQLPEWLTSEVFFRWRVAGMAFKLVGLLRQAPPVPDPVAAIFPAALGPAPGTPPELPLQRAL